MSNLFYNHYANQEWKEHTTDNLVLRKDQEGFYVECIVCGEIANCQYKNILAFLQFHDHDSEQYEALGIS